MAYPDHNNDIASDRPPEEIKNYNFDHPAALDFDLLRISLKKLINGEDVEVPHYDFGTHMR